MLVAESGTVVIVCNEGNNRMSVALPDTHIVVAGIEKMVGTFAEAMNIIRLLPRSATGQVITTYTNFITGPRPGQEQHIVLIDNGRTEMNRRPEYADALSCIRCGACANVCPSFQVVGGHRFGHIYTGPIGLVVTPFHHGLEAAAAPQELCVSCGACTAVCPAEIPLAQQILQLRSDVREQLPGGVLRRLLLRSFGRRWLFAAALKDWCCAHATVQTRTHPAGADHYQVDIVEIAAIASNAPRTSSTADQEGIGSTFTHGWDPVAVCQ